MMEIGKKLFYHWDVAAMCIAMSILFGFELLGVFGARYVTITQITRTYMPKWVQAMILGWLCYHFMIQGGK